uniref:ERVV2 protein n=1 Tax=Oncorhynchus mykiss TaxID=8022 RepID=A0A8C7RGT1_ONCMY
FFAIAFPSYGISKITREVINMANSLDILANSTAESLELITAEMVAIRTVAMENCLALDYLLFARGVTCAVIGAECCTYIPENSDEITNLIQKIRIMIFR